MRKSLTQPVLMLGAALLLGGCGNDGGKPEQAPRTAVKEPKALWPAPKDPLKRTVAAGLKPERKEFLIHHAHAHLA